MNAEYDLLICIYACDTIPKYSQQILKVQETWGAKAKTFPKVKLLFFLGEEEAIPECVGADYVHLKGIGNDYLSCSYKQFLGLEYIRTHFTVRFVFVCGTDTFVNVPKVLQYMDHFNHNEKWYIGGHGDSRDVHGKQIYFHSGGPGFLLSWATLNALGPYLTTYMEKWLEISVDTFHGSATACDVAIACLMQMEPSIQPKIYDQKGFAFTHCNYKGLLGSFVCCGQNVQIPNILSCHNMSLTDFDTLTQILDKNNWYVS